MAQRIGDGKAHRGLAAKLAAKGVRNPDALAASIGRRKFGKARFNALAQKGREAVKSEASRAERAERRVKL